MFSTQAKHVRYRQYLQISKQNNGKYFSPYHLTSNRYRTIGNDSAENHSNPSDVKIHSSAHAYRVPDCLMRSSRTLSALRTHWTWFLCLSYKFTADLSPVTVSMLKKKSGGGIQARGSGWFHRWKAVERICCHVISFDRFPPKRTITARSYTLHCSSIYLNTWHVKTIFNNIAIMQINETRYEKRSVEIISLSVRQ